MRDSVFVIKRLMGISADNDMLMQGNGITTQDTIKIYLMALVAMCMTS